MFSRQRGFGYLFMLFAIASLGAILAGLGQVWTTTAKRERETQLLFIGSEFSRALTGYYAGAPNGVKEWPQSLDDLLQDKRFPFTVRHLRRIYKDPVTGQADWILVRNNDRIVGIHSASEKETIQTQVPDYVMIPPGASAQAVTRYADWVFVAKADPSEKAPSGTQPGAEGNPGPNAGNNGGVNTNPRATPVNAGAGGMGEGGP